ncbi:GEVED domain-containing protein [uncultured Kordia sp.]|uniref:GEVED domain-containing protein n=1 Tax=uncultured Kordia sp. TaxID=507699 RepID=UPI002611297F|nr:GEVED domain-containing protein [uncultured Kordia sp.]
MKKLLLIPLLLCMSFAFSQNNPTVIIQGEFKGKTIPLRDFAVNQEEDYRVNEIRIISNNLRANEKLNPNGLPINGVDPLRQRSNGNYSAMFNLEENFDGISVNESGGSTPPDPSGAAGPNHYVNAVNTAVKIFDKNGNTLAGPTPLGTFLGSGNNDGDPIIMYDHLADRYFVSQFGAATNSLVLGVSDTPDPTGAYNVYEFVFDAFPDYPHYSIWPDGYYLTANKGGAETVYVLERDVILNGDPNPQIVGFALPGIVNNPNTVFSPEPANLLGNAYPTDVPGYIVYLQDDGWSTAITNDHLKVWEIDMDWNVPANSAISAPLEIPLGAFDSVFAPFGTGDVDQPGTNQKIDMIGGVISYAANYRSFGVHNSWVITFNVDVDGNDTSGVRWIELRNSDSTGWSVYQEGTYAPADGLSRFMGSAAIDLQGNIGLGFNIAGPATPVGIAYTGRFSSDPLGQMSVAETTIVDGVGVQTFSNRFGDYSHLTMDPDGFTFWHTAEYFAANNSWRSRVASFSLSPGFDNDTGIINIVTPENGILTNSEAVEVTIRNFGNLTQSNIPVELRVDGTLVASEVFTGTLNSGETANYTFSQNVDLSNSGQTYTIEAKTSLATDQFTQNDPYTKDVTHLLNNDVGVISIITPETASGLGNETVTVTVRNFGANVQNNIPIQFTVDGGTPIGGTITTAINPEQTLDYTFPLTADLSNIAVYTITATTLLVGDQMPSNDSVTTMVENTVCAPTADCTLGDGLRLFSIAEINNSSACEGYGDFTDQIASLEPGVTYPLTVTTNYGNQYLTVWIDFNDNNIFETNEKVVTDFILGANQTGGTFTDTVDVTIPADANQGTFRMRAKTNWNAAVPDDACVETTYGETEDYTASIQTLSVEEFSLINNSDLKIIEKGENQFQAVLNTSYDGSVYAAIYNINGQQLKFKNLSRSSADSYIVNLDMSQAASGIYTLKVGGTESNAFITEKFIVK